MSDVFIYNRSVALSFLRSVMWRVFDAFLSSGWPRPSGLLAEGPLMVWPHPPWCVTAHCFLIYLHPNIHQKAADTFDKMHTDSSDWWTPVGPLRDSSGLVPVWTEVLLTEGAESLLVFGLLPPSSGEDVYFTSVPVFLFTIQAPNGFILTKEEYSPCPAAMKQTGTSCVCIQQQQQLFSLHSDPLHSALFEFQCSLFCLFSC